MVSTDDVSTAHHPLLPGRGHAWGFVAHILVEAPACVNFLLFPSGQLGTHTAHAHAVIRQYAVLILSSLLVALVFVRRPLDETAGQVAGALAVYHVAPALRSVMRLARRSQTGRSLVASEAALYLTAHGICCATLLHHYWAAVYRHGRT